MRIAKGSCVSIAREKGHNMDRECPSVKAFVDFFFNPPGTSQ